MAEDVIIKAKIEVDAENAAKSVDKVKGSLSSVSKEANGSASVFGNLKKTLTDVSPAAESASKASGIFNSALNVLRANPIIAALAGLVAIVIGLFQPFKRMEAVSDSLGKAFGVLGGVFSGFINKVLTPLIDGFTFLVDLFTNSVVSVLETLGLTSKETAEEFGKITEGLDDLEDAQRKNAIATAESNRLLQEAREIAADANVPIKERIKAIQDASRIEKEQLDNVVEYNRKKTELELKRMALELGARSELIEKIKEGSLASLKAAKAELELLPQIDKKKLESIDAQIIAAENAAAQKAQIGKKEIKQVSAIQKEQEAKDKEAADKRKAEREKEAADQKKYLDYKNKLQNEANLAAITDEVALAKQKILNQQKDKLKEIDLLKTSEENKAQLRAMIAKSTEQEIAKIEHDARAKRLQKEGEDERAAEAERKKVQDDISKKREDAQQKRLEQLEKNKAEREKQLQEITNRTLTTDEKYNSELAALDAKYKKELELVGTNEALKAKLEQEYAEATTQLKQDHLNKQLDEVENVGNAIIGIVGQQTAVGKGIGVANALINTYQGATDALRAKSTLPSPFDVIAKIANVSAVLASGFKAVKAITAVQVPGASGGGGGATPSMPAPVSPQQTSTQLNQASINAVGNAAQGGVNRAFVLSSDISNDADKMARINRAARLG
jgi:hypothetical protein